MIKLKITTFGSLGKLTLSEPIVIQMASGSDFAQIISFLKDEIRNKFPEFNDFETIDKSALANSQEVLGKAHIFTQDMDLVILPPICGG